MKSNNNFLVVCCMVSLAALTTSAVLYLQDSREAKRTAAYALKQKNQPKKKPKVLSRTVCRGDGLLQPRQQLRLAKHVTDVPLEMAQSTPRHISSKQRRLLLRSRLDEVAKVFAHVERIQGPQARALNRLEDRCKQLEQSNFVDINFDTRSKKYRRELL